MNKLVCALLSIATMMSLSGAAFADEVEAAPAPVASTAPSSDGVYKLQVITVYGRRPSKPLVVIELTRPTAAHEAGAAHDGLHATLVQQSVPPALRAAEQARAAAR